MCIQAEIEFKIYMNLNTQSIPAQANFGHFR